MDRLRAFARRVYRRSGLRCLLGRHHPVRVGWVSGFRCAACGATGADYEDFGFGPGYVPTVRRVFSREHAQVTRTSAWTPGERGW